MKKDIDSISFDIIQKSATGCLLLEKVEETNNYQMVYVNKAFERMFHINLSEIENVEFTKLLDDVNFKKAKIKDIFSQVIKSGITYKESLYSYKYSRHFHISIYKIDDEYVGVSFLDLIEADKSDNDKVKVKEALSDDELRFQIDMLSMIKHSYEEKEKVYRLIADVSSEGFTYKNIKTGIKISSSKWHEMFNIDKNEADIETAVKNRIYEHDILNYNRQLNEAIFNKKQEVNIDFRTSQGDRWITSRHLFEYDNGECIRKISFYTDITDYKNKQLELEYMAYYDNQTGVYNRDYFSKQLSAEIEKAKKNGTMIQVIDINIDNFKRINDTIGFDYGDELIKLFANSLKAMLSSKLKVGRMNNDEFMIAIYDADNEYAAEDIYRDISRILEVPYKLSNGLEMYLIVSIGAVSFPENGQNATDLMKLADIAMLQVKENDKNGFVKFEKYMLDEFMSNVKIEQKLKHAVERETFYLCYQPQYDSVTNKLRGVEALIRWNDISEGHISPSKFIPIAEKMGYILSIGNWVMRESICAYTRWRNNYKYDGIISINISALQLKDKRFTDILLHYVRMNDISPSKIEIEITESVFIDDFAKMTIMLQQLSEYGFKISLDDFGTGYSSLAYLKDIPIDTLKIDKSFIDTMIIDKSTSIITKAVIDTVSKLGLETIAEGVETEEQYNYLKSMKCNNIQGYYLAKPMREDEIIKVIIEECA